MKIKWKCLSCGSIHTSNSKEHHTCDFCECGNSFMDLEEGYSRQGGEIEIIERVKDGNRTDS